MHYVITDLHGKYDDYLKLLVLINFCSDDELHILGDVCDRGDKSVELYLDIMSRDNIYMIRGNHEEMLLYALPETFGFLKKRNLYLPYEDMYDTDMWNANGGDVTKLSFFRQDRATIETIYDFITSLPYYRIVTLNNTDYILVHAGLDDFAEEKSLGDYTSEEILWYSPDFDATFWNDRKYLIVGHTPTFIFREDGKAEIYHGKGNVIAIDCGAAYRDHGGRLGCLCLETMEEFYV